MNKVLVFFAVVLAAASATAPLDFLPPLFENGKFPTIDALNSGLTQGVNLIVQPLAGLSFPLPDITKKHIYGNNKIVLLKLTEGQLFGADSKFFVDEATTLTRDDINAYIKSQYGYEKFIANYNYKSKREGLLTRGTIVVEIVEFLYQTELTVNLETLKLDYVFSVVNEGEVTITVNGQMNERIAQIVKNKIHDEVITLAKQRAAAVIDEYNTNLEQ